MSILRPSILLDLDGTLIDSQPGILSSCRVALRAMGHDPGPLTDLEHIIGPPIEDVMRYLLKPFGDTRVAEAVELYRSDYGERGLFIGELYLGITKALQSMRSQGGRLFLATSKRKTFAQRILENLGLHDLFDGIYGSEPRAGIDHKPELIAYILAQNTLVADQCVMVGDRKFDIVGAHANFMKAIGVLWGYGSKEELEAAGADRLIDQTTELSSMALELSTAN